MANEEWEACQLWIKQEVKVGLDQEESLRAIGRRISEEVKKHFGADIKPDTITKKAERMKTQTAEIIEHSEGVTNVTRAPKYVSPKLTADSGNPLCPVCQTNYVRKRNRPGEVYEKRCGTCGRLQARINKLDKKYSSDVDATSDDWRKIVLGLIQSVELLKSKNLHRDDRILVDSLIGIIKTWHKKNLNGGI